MKRFLLANIYAPNSDNPDFFEDVFCRLDQTGLDRKIIGGDFNLVLDQGIDHKGKGFHKHTQSIATVKSLIETMDLIDIWREHNRNNPGFTWRRSKPFPIFEWLDFFLVSQSMQQLVSKVLVLPALQSDHSSVKLEITTNFHQRGSGYWKLNTQLLRDRDYLDMMNKLLEVQIAQSDAYKSKLDHWEIIKLATSTATVQYSVHKKKSEQNKLKVLEKKLKF